MNIDEASVQERCTDAVFERGKNYRDDGRIRRLKRFDDTVTAAVRGSDVYDVTVELGGDDIDARCPCPYAGPGECKHVVAVLLDVVHDPPEDEIERVNAAIGAVPPDDLRAFVRDALAENPILRERFLARFGEERRSIDEYRVEAETLFERHARDDSLVTAAIDFSHLFDLAEQYRTRERSRRRDRLPRAVRDDRRQRRAHRRRPRPLRRLYELLSMATSSVSSPRIPRTRTSRSTPQFSRTESRNTASTRRCSGADSRRSKRDGDPVRLDDRIHLGLNLHRSNSRPRRLIRKVVVRPARPSW